MLSFLVFICTLKYIPDEFQDIRAKAIQSSKIRKLSNFKAEPIISPSKPYVTDSFVGTVLYPVFGPTVKELKGFSISQSKQHMALIVDRDSESGISILKENSVFIGENNITVSLSHKFADDGEVAIFNLTETDPLAVFNNFDIKLSSFDYKCKGNFGRDLGGRCQANLSLNYDVDQNKPNEVKISQLPQAVKDKITFYGGVYATAVASVTVKRRGMAISVEFNGGLDVIGGAGFHITKVDKLNLDKEIPLGNEKEVDLGTAKIPIFTATVELNTKIFAGLVAKDLILDIPHDITIMRKLSVHLKKGFTVSTKHSSTSDFEKKIQISKIDTDAKELGPGEEESIKADFSGEFVVRAGVKVELKVNSDVDFRAKVGPEFGLNLSVGADTEKCVFPGLYGHFSPYVNSFLELSGMLKIAKIKLLDIKKSWLHQIYEFKPFDGCFFDSSSSKELDKQLLQKPEVQRDILQVINPAVKDGVEFTEEFFVLLLAGGKNQNQFSYIGTGSIGLNVQGKSQYNHYYVIPQSKAYAGISAVTIYPELYEDYKALPFESQAFETKSLKFECISEKSQPISIGNQFNIDNLDSFFNFRPKFMPSSKNKHSISVILHTKKDGYICDHNNFLITDEVFDIIDDSIHNWVKFTIKQTIVTHICYLYFSQWIKEEEQFRLISVQLCRPLEEGGEILPAFTDFNFMAQIKPDMKQNDVMFQIEIQFLPENEVEQISVTYGEIIQSTEFTKTSANSEVKLTFTSENSNAIEYILKLNEEYTHSIKNDPNLEMKAIVARSSFSDDPSKYIYKGNQIASTIIMQQDESYGVFEFYFDASIYDLPNNDNVFAFFKLENATPLSESKTIVDEAESLYVIKLEIGKCVSYHSQYPSNAILSIPFRRLSKAKDERIECTLYSIFQSYENNKNSSPFCPDFPSFKIKSIDKFYVGCVRTYVDARDKAENEWGHYPEKKVTSVDYPLGTVDKGSFSRLHQISLLNTQTNTENNEPIEIVAKQQYFNFPLTSRTMIIEDSTIRSFKQFAHEPIRIQCPRCADIYQNSFLNGEKVYKSSQGYEIPVDQNTEGFTLQAMCKPETEDKLRTFCVFDYDINGDGYTLLEYKRYKDDEMTDLTGKVLEEETKEKEMPTEYPGVEEIYEIEKDTIPKSRLNINCKRQIVPTRTDKFYLTKPWEGSVVKLATHLEQGVIDIELTATIESDLVEIKVEGKGFKAKNSAIDDTQLLPFNPVFFTESEEQFKTLLNQVGVVNFNSIDDVTTNNYVEVDDDGKLIIKKEKFDKGKLKSSVNNNKIDLIPIPSENYKLSYTEIDNSGSSKKKKLSTGAIVGITIGCVAAVAIIVVLVIIFCSPCKTSDIGEGCLP